MKIEYFPSEEGFLNIPESEQPSDIKAVIIPFGLENSVSYGGGTAKGTQAILEASSEVELFDEQLWCEPFRKYGVSTIKPFPIPEKIPEALDLIEGIVGDVLAAGKFPLTLGGEHSITAGTIRPFAKKYNDLAILHFDAHADLRDGYNGEHYSHAAALRRCLDFDHIKLVSIGIRNISAGEIPFLEANRHRIDIHFAKDKAEWDIAKIVEPLRGRPVYLTFDVDGFDGALMPATGTPEPGGILWWEAIKIIEAASKISTIVGADVNELAPIENYHAADFLAAKLVYKILNFALGR